MNGLIRASLRNPYAVTVMCLTLVMLGAVATSMIPIDILPAFKSPAVQVLTFYGGMNRMERWVGQDAPSGQALHDAAQIIEVPGQPIHAVHHHRVALAHESQQRFQLRALSVLARCRVGEHASDLDVLQLAFRVLVEAADPDVADALTVQGPSFTEFCQVELYGP